MQLMSVSAVEMHLGYKSRSQLYKLMNAGRRWLTEDAAGLMPVASRQRFTKALAAELQGFRTIPSRPLRVDALVEEADNIYRLLPLLFLACFREGRLLSRTVCFL